MFAHPSRLVLLVPVWHRLTMTLAMLTSAGLALAGPVPPSAEFGVGLKIRDEPADMVVDGDGRVVLAGGEMVINGAERTALARLRVDGSLDLAFYAEVGSGSVFSHLALQPDGKILAAGSFYEPITATKRSVARFHSDGTWDRSFVSAVSSTFTRLALQPDGKVLMVKTVGTLQQPTVTVVRLNTDGSVDSSFSSAVVINSYIHSMVLEPDGQVLAGGFFTQAGGVAMPKLVRLNPDGTLDTGFQPALGG